MDSIFESQFWLQYQDLFMFLIYLTLFMTFIHICYNLYFAFKKFGNYEVIAMNSTNEEEILFKENVKTFDEMSAIEKIIKKYKLQKQLPNLTFKCKKKKSNFKK